MTKLIVTGHGKFASGLIDVVNFIMGEQKNLIKINYNNQDLEVYSEEIETEIKSAASNNEVTLVLTDLIGGTPFRISSNIAKKYNDVHVLSGVNVPILIEAVLRRETLNPPELIKHLIRIGRKGIDSLENLLKNDGKE